MRSQDAGDEPWIVNVMHSSRKPQDGGGWGTPGDSPGTHGELVPRAGRRVSESRGRDNLEPPPGGVSPGVGPGLGAVTVDRCHGLPSWMLQFESMGCPSTRP